MSELSGKNAIITGAGRGLGRAYARKLAGLGAKVAAVDKDLRSYRDFAGERDLMTADSTVDEIVAAGGQALGFECDVTDPAAQADVAKQVFDRWGSVDILVANAGGGSGTPATTTASTLDPEQLRIVVERNLYGTIFSCVAVAPYMKEQRQGKIITTSSIAGIQAITGGGYAHYGAAKAGIAMYTRYLAHDLGQYGITCNCIAPGVVATGRIVAVGVGDPNKTSSPNAAGRAGTVDELADVVAFLASDASSYLNGAVIPVDGGSSRGAA